MQIDWWQIGGLAKNQQNIYNTFSSPPVSLNSCVSFTAQEEMHHRIIENGAISYQSYLPHQLRFRHLPLSQPSRHPWQVDNHSSPVTLLQQTIIAAFHSLNNLSFNLHLHLHRTCYSTNRSTILNEELQPALGTYNVCATSNTRGSLLKLGSRGNYNSEHHSILQQRNRSLNLYYSHS